MNHTTLCKDTQLDASACSRLDHAFEEAFARTWAPGMVAGVWIGDRGWTAARGTAERGLGPPPVLDVHTRIGSVTKTMTGTLILQLVDEGKLDLDDTIDRWFADVPEAPSITVRHLGIMASGIASYSQDEAISGRYFGDPLAAWTPDELIAGGAALPRQFTAGDGFSYSNTNYVMLGRIVEMVTGKPLADVMRSKLFDPLGMHGSSYPTTSSLPEPRWRGYTVQGSTNGAVLDNTDASPTFSAGAGQVTSTLEDLHRWTAALGTGELLEPSTRREQLTPNAASDSGGRAYLFGVGRDHGWLAHTGVIPGYNSQIAYLPSLAASVVVIANADIGRETAAGPAPLVFGALAQVIAPENVPAG